MARTLLNLFLVEMPGIESDSSFVTHDDTIDSGVGHLAARLAPHVVVRLISTGERDFGVDARLGTGKGLKELGSSTRGSVRLRIA